MTAPVGNLAVRFSADGAETVRRAVDQISTVAKQAAATAGKAAADAATRISQAHTATQQQYARTIEAAERAAYAEQAARERTARLAQQSVNAVAANTMGKYGMMALSAASSFNAITYSGKVSGDALKNIFQQTALVGASMFGGSGPIVAAVAVSALAISNLFTKTNEEARKAEAEARSRAAALVNSGDLEGLRKAAFALKTGTPANNYKDGIDARQRRLEELGNPLDLVGGLDRSSGINAAASERLKLIRTERAALAPLLTEYARLNQLIENFADPKTLPKTAPIVITPDAIARRALRALPTGGRSASTLGSGDLDDRPDTMGLLGVQLKNPAAPVKRTIEQMVEEFRAQQSRLSTGIADSISMGLAAGINAAITSGSIGQAFSALGATVLANFGNIFADIAVNALKQATFMAKFMSFLTTNPIAAVGVAIGMMALARAMGGGRSARVAGIGGSGASYGGVAAGSATESVTRLIFGNNSVATAAGMTPRQANHFTIIGPDDPSAQRAIAEILRRSESRGLLPSR